MLLDNNAGMNPIFGPLIETEPDEGLTNHRTKGQRSDANRGGSPELIHSSISW